MSTDEEPVRSAHAMAAGQKLLNLAQQFLGDKLSAANYCDAHWVLRGLLLSGDTDPFQGFGSIASDFDSSTDSYSPEPDALFHEIDAERLRAEIADAAGRLAHWLETGEEIVRRDWRELSTRRDET